MVKFVIAIILILIVAYTVVFGKDILKQIDRSPFAATTTSQISPTLSLPTATPAPETDLDTIQQNMDSFNSDLNAIDADLNTTPPVINE